MSKSYPYSFLIINFNKKPNSNIKVYNHIYNCVPITRKAISINLIIFNLCKEFIILYFIKLGCFINKVTFYENSYIINVELEYYIDKDNNKQTIKFIEFWKAFIQKHCELFFFNKKKSFFVFNNLNTITLNQSIVLEILPKNIEKQARLLTKICWISNYWPAAPLFASVFSYLFKNNFNKEIILIEFVNQLFSFFFNIKNSNFRSIRFEIKGRVGGSNKSKSYISSKGSLPLQTINKYYLSYGFESCNTQYGICSIKVFFGYYL